MHAERGVSVISKYDTMTYNGLEHPWIFFFFFKFMVGLEPIPMDAEG